MVARYRVAFGVVAFAVAATAAVVLFARPADHGPGSTVHDVKPLPYVRPAERGWTWEHGIPGFRFGRDEDRWNVSRLHWADLAPLRYAARRAQVDPQSLRVLEGERLAPRTRPLVLVGGRGSGGGTCVGAQPGTATPRFFCGRELRDELAILVVAPQPRFGTGNWPLFLAGVVAARVTRATLTTTGAAELIVRGTRRWTKPTGPEVVYDRATWRSWGTFVSYRGQPVPWNARLELFDARRRLATIRLRFTRPGAYVYCASAFSGVGSGCAQRRS